MTDLCDENHPKYEKYIPRINKITGQLNGIKRMIEDQRYCTDIISQLKAVSSACQSLEIIMLEKHLEKCVMDTFKSNDANGQAKKIKELPNYIKNKGATILSNYYIGSYKHVSNDMHSSTNEL